MKKSKYVNVNNGNKMMKTKIASNALSIHINIVYKLTNSSPANEVCFVDPNISIEMTQLYFVTNIQKQQHHQQQNAKMKKKKN